MYGLLDGLAQQFQFSYEVIQLHTTDLTQEETLLQFPYPANCLNWVLGHVVATRGRTVQLMGGEHIWSKEQAKLYTIGSAPITAENAHTALRLEQMLADFAIAHERTLAILPTLTETDFAKPVGQQNLFYWLNRLAFHEAYHAGQFEYLRKLTGKPDVGFI
jgi:hypothetical protein